MRLRAALIAGLAALCRGRPRSADTWTVTNGSSDATTPACNADTKQCVSLRTALAASEATKEVPDTINVPAGTININNDLVIQSDITVVGTSARTNIIDGGGEVPRLPGDGRPATRRSATSRSATARRGRAIRRTAAGSSTSAGSSCSTTCA